MNRSRFLVGFRQSLDSQSLELLSFRWPVVCLAAIQTTRGDVSYGGNPTTLGVPHARNTIHPWTTRVKMIPQINTPNMIPLPLTAVNLQGAWIAPLLTLIARRKRFLNRMAARDSILTTSTVIATAAHVNCCHRLKSI